MRFRFFVLSAILWAITTPSSSQTIRDYAMRGDIAGIAAALDQGTDVNDYNGLNTPLTEAVKKGHFAAAALLIQRGADVNTPTRYYGEPIMLAALQSRADLMKLLLTHGAIADSVLNGEPVLHVAAAMGCLNCVKLLVEAGADVNWEQKDRFTRSALGIATFYGYNDIAAYLKAHGAGRAIWVDQSSKP